MKLNISQQTEEESMMPFKQCPVCGGDLIEKEIDKLLRGGMHTAVVHVSAEVCLRCGECYYSQETVRYFEQIRTKLKRQETADLELVGKFFSVSDQTNKSFAEKRS